MSDGSLPDVCLSVCLPVCLYARVSQLRCVLWSRLGRSEPGGRRSWGQDVAQFMPRRRRCLPTVLFFFAMPQSLPLADTRGLSCLASVRPQSDMARPAQPADH